MSDRMSSIRHQNSRRIDIPVAQESSPSRKYKVRRAVAGVALGLGAVGAAGGLVAGALHNIHEAETHSIDYLNDYPQKTVVVRPGDTANQLLNEATGGEAGQLRADELAYIERQGTAHDPAGHPELQANQIIEIPIPPADE